MDNTYQTTVQPVSSQTNRAPASSITVPATWLNRILPSLSTLLDYGLLEGGTATFLATSLAISMAQWPRQALNYTAATYLDTNLISDSPNAQRAFVNASFRLFQAGGHVLYQDTGPAEAEGKYRLWIDVSYQGYGYQINQTTKIIAIFVLAAYCLYILTFLVLMLWFNRVHSSAWDSIGELTALAIMSRPDEKLRNTSAGIETVALFKLPMNIRANDNNHLEIVFGDDGGSSRSGFVEKDRKYK